MRYVYIFLCFLCSYCSANLLADNYLFSEDLFKQLYPDPLKNGDLRLGGIDANGNVAEDNVPMVYWEGSSSHIEGFYPICGWTIASNNDGANLICKKLGFTKGVNSYGIEYSSEWQQYVGKWHDAIDAMPIGKCDKNSNSILDCNAAIDQNWTNVFGKFTETNPLCTKGTPYHYGVNCSGLLCLNPTTPSNCNAVLNCTAEHEPYNGCAKVWRLDLIDEYGDGWQEGGTIIVNTDGTDHEFNWIPEKINGLWKSKKKSIYLPFENTITVRYGHRGTRYTDGIIFLKERSFTLSWGDGDLIYNSGKKTEEQWFLTWQRDIPIKSYGALSCTAKDTPYPGCLEQICTAKNTPYPGCVEQICTAKDTPYPGCLCVTVKVTDSNYEGCTPQLCNPMPPAFNNNFDRKTPHSGCLCLYKNFHDGCVDQNCTGIDAPYSGCTEQNCTNGKDIPYEGCIGQLCTAEDKPYPGCLCTRLNYPPGCTGAICTAPDIPYKNCLKVWKIDLFDSEGDGWREGGTIIVNADGEEQVITWLPLHHSGADRQKTVNVFFESYITVRYGDRGTRINNKFSLNHRSYTISWNGGQNVIESGTKTEEQWYPEWQKNMLIASYGALPCTAKDKPYPGCIDQMCTDKDTPYKGCVEQVCSGRNIPYEGCLCLAMEIDDLVIDCVPQVCNLIPEGLPKNEDRKAPHPDCLCPLKEYHPGCIEQVCTAKDTPYEGCLCSQKGFPEGCTEQKCSAKNIPYPGCLCPYFPFPGNCTKQICTAKDTPYEGCTCSSLNYPEGCTERVCTAKDTPYFGCLCSQKGFPEGCTEQNCELTGKFPPLPYEGCLCPYFGYNPENKNKTCVEQSCTGRDEPYEGCVNMLCGIGTKRIGNECVCPFQQVTCGHGTVEKDNVCVLKNEYVTCGPGTIEQNNVCVLKNNPITCGSGTTQHGTQCIVKKKSEDSGTSGGLIALYVGGPILIIGGILLFVFCRKKSKHPKGYIPLKGKEKIHF